MMYPPFTRVKSEKTIDGAWSLTNCFWAKVFVLSLVLNWVVAAPFVGAALNESFVTFTAVVADANGNRGSDTRTPQLTDSAPNGDALTPRPR